MTILINRTEYLDAFIRLNEAWIRHYFQIEKADQVLARNPGKIIEDGGYVFTLLVNNEIAGGCALFKDDGNTFQLARMAVTPEHQGKGYGDALMQAVIDQLHAVEANRVYLLSNKKLKPAISLYAKYGFTIVSEGQHPDYVRCDIVMEKKL